MSPPDDSGSVVSINTDEASVAELLADLEEEGGSAYSAQTKSSTPDDVIVYEDVPDEEIPIDGTAAQGQEDEAEVVVYLSDSEDEKELMRLHRLVDVGNSLESSTQIHGQSRAKRKTRGDVNYCESPSKRKRGGEADPQPGGSGIMPNTERKCGQCNQRMDKTLQPVDLNSLPDGVSEEELLAIPRLRIEGADEIEYNLQNFIVFDKYGHLVPIFSEVINLERTDVFLSGQAKHLTIPDLVSEESDENEELTVQIKKSGRLTGWYQANLPEDIQVQIMLYTEVNGQPVGYYLKEPHPLYEPLYRRSYKFAYLHSRVIDWLTNPEREPGCNFEYDDLVDFCANLEEPELNGRGLEPIDEDYLFENSRLLSEYIYAFQDAAEPDEPDICSLPAIKKLFRLSGFSKRCAPKLRQPAVRRSQQQGRRAAQLPCSKTRTTPLITQIFGQQFKAQLTEAEDLQLDPYKGCGKCVNCKRDSCGRCEQCKLMVSYGGSEQDGTYTCDHRQCLFSFQLLGVDEDADDDEEEDGGATADGRPAVRWLGESRPLTSTINVFQKCRLIFRKGQRAASGAAVALDLEPGRFVLFKHGTDCASLQLQVARILYLYQWDEDPDPALRRYAHVQIFQRGADTCLGQVGNPREFFATDRCQELPLSMIDRSLDIMYRAVDESSEWRRRGGTTEAELKADEGSSCFWHLRYDMQRGRFEYPEEEGGLPMDDMECTLCIKRALRIEEDALHNGRQLTLDPQKQVISVGPRLELSCGDLFYLEDVAGQSTDLRMRTTRPESVLLPATTFRKKTRMELWGRNVWDPLIVVQLRRLASERALVTPFYRPQNTQLSYEAARERDLSVLYPTNQEVWLDIHQLSAYILPRHQPTLVYGPDELRDAMVRWTDEADDRFYVNQSYDVDKNEFRNLTEKEARELNIPPFLEHQASTPSPRPVRPLRMMDLFSGAGGLSTGLELSGCAKALWAVEFCSDAAKAFELNHPAAKVYNEDSSDLLERVLAGTDGPAKGEVELLVGGPPCQGFSRLNMHQKSAASQLKNSAVASFLSFADYYRPRFLLIENVTALTHSDTGMIMKLMLSSLVCMGYQTAFGVLDAGHHGVPQRRQRIFILGAAPGEQLPAYPLPRYCAMSSHDISLPLDTKYYKINGEVVRPGATRRCITVWDALSDLPEIRVGPDGKQTAKAEEMAYPQPPRSHIQRYYYRSKGKLVDHIVAPLNELYQARIQRIPTKAFSDWRDLPNERIILPISGKEAAKIKYIYRSPGSKEPDAICICATNTSKTKKVACDFKEAYQNKDRYFIPLFCVHNYRSHNNWQGVYGRVPWDHQFRTVLTNPMPSSQQGTVLHPEQHRMCSVREFARAQGFMDSFQFSGDIKMKLRQVGNAVPPPLGQALGRELLKSMQFLTILLD